jgi:glycosyltransferase involved in cell wall biosynthesis
MEISYSNSKDLQPPKLTIGLGVYNDARFLRGGLESLLCQTYNDFELIISDNASTDETPEIIREYANKDSRIRVFRQPKNVGLVRNFNFLRKQARGEYYMWAACDDRYSPDYVKTVICGMENDSTIVLGFTPYQFIDEAEKTFGGEKRFDFSGGTAFIRLLRFFFLYDDGTVYGIFRHKAIKNLDFPIWWGKNANTPLDPGYAFLTFILATGKFQLYGTQPMFFNCIKAAEHFQPFKQERKAIQFLLFFLLRKINVAYVQFLNIWHGSSSLLLALTFIPILLLRIAMDLIILITNIARKNFRKILSIPNS